MNQLVSVILTTYNRKIYICKAIDSILNQSYKNLELIIVDDCSTDGTLELIEQVYGNEERIIYILNDNNVGPSKARNIGALAANGEWIAFHDSDDVWLPEKLEKQLRLLDEKSEAKLCYTCIHRFFNDGYHDIWPPKSMPLEEKQGNIYAHVLLNPLISTQTILVDKKSFFDVGGFREDIRSLDDYEFSIRFSKKYNIVLLDEEMVNVYETAGSIGQQADEKIRVQCLILKDHYEDFVNLGVLKKKLNLIYAEALNYKNTYVISDNIRTLANHQDIFDEFIRIENLLLQKRKSNAKYILAFFFNDQNITRGDLTRPELGNPGMGGSEYELLLVIKGLIKYREDVHVVVYHLNNKNLLPWGCEQVLLNDKYDIAAQLVLNKISKLVYIIEFEKRWYDLLEAAKINGILWMTNYPEYYGDKFIQLFEKYDSVYRLLCVGQKQFENCCQYDVFKNKGLMINNICEVNNQYYRDNEYKGIDITYIGGLYPKKGFHILAKAWKDILAIHKNAVLHVIGSGKLYSDQDSLGDYNIAESSYEKVFMPYITDENGEILPSVIFHGILGPEKNEIISKSCVGVVNPSGDTETFCISAAEFFGCGVPVVTKNVPGITDVVIHNINGICIDTYDQLVPAICKLIENRQLNEMLGHNGYEHVRESFNTKRIIEEWYQKLIDIKDSEVTI